MRSMLSRSRLTEQNSILRFVILVSGLIRVSLLQDRITEEPCSSSSIDPHASENLPKDEDENTFDSSFGALEIVEEPDTPTFEEQTAESLNHPETFDDNDSDDSLTVRKLKTPGRKKRDETPQMKIYKLIKRTPCPPSKFFYQEYC